MKLLSILVIALVAAACGGASEYERVTDSRLRADTESTFHVEQEGDNDIGSGACAP